MTAPSSLPTTTSSSGSHSLCEFTGQVRRPGATSESCAGVTISMRGALCTLQHRPCTEVPSNRRALTPTPGVRLGRQPQAHQALPPSAGTVLNRRHLALGPGFAQLELLDLARSGQRE